MNDTSRHGHGPGPVAPPVAPPPPAGGHDCCHAAAAGPPAAVAVTSANEAAYLCPMCPGVGSEVPASCPKCGMALEAALPTRAGGDDPELVDMRRRLRVALAFGLPLVLWEMAVMIGLARAPAQWPWLQLALATPVVLWAGWPLLERAWRSVVNRSPNMFTLIGLGVAVAWGYSVVATVAPGLVPATMRHGAHPALYFESATMIVALVLLGQVLELRARSRTGDALRALMDLAPPTARRISEEGEEVEVPLAEVQAGDRLRVPPGAQVPVDGVVLEGSSAVDESLVTGESLPVAKGPGDPLIGGTLNGNGALLMRAERVGGETLLAGIVRSVARAQRSRAPVQALADRVAAWFVPAVIAVALAAALAWYLLGPEPRLGHAIVVAVSTLVIACPCALGLATPMAVTVAMGRGARAGVLFRDAAALERLNAVDTVVFDKTGTLTRGRPEVVSVIPVDEVADAELLRFAASLEQTSEHPLAGAVVALARRRGLRLGRSYGFRAVPGKGAMGVVQLRNVAVGNAALMAEAGVDVGALEPEAERLRQLGQTVVHVAIDGAAMGLLGIADPLKPEAWEAVQALKAEGLRLVVLSGDHEASVRAVAGQLGIDEVAAGVLPEDKAARVRALRAEGRVVAMVGDGLNDAPALAEADVGIAMGAGTEVARRSSAVTLVSGDLHGLPRALRLAEATLGRVRENLWFAFGYNLLGVPLAAGLLYPFTGLLLAPVFAAAAMSLSSVSVIANSLRLRSIPL
jgi:Cu+-exporting ATPase